MVSRKIRVFRISTLWVGNTVQDISVIHTMWWEKGKKIIFLTFVVVSLSPPFMKANWHGGLFISEIEKKKKKICQNDINLTVHVHIKNFTKIKYCPIKHFFSNTPNFMLNCTVNTTKRVLLQYFPILCGAKIWVYWLSFRKCKKSQELKFRCPKYVEMADSTLQESPKLISRKIWVMDNKWNFRTVFRLSKSCEISQWSKFTFWKEDCLDLGHCTTNT